MFAAIKNLVLWGAIAVTGTALAQEDSPILPTKNAEKPLIKALEFVSAENGIPGVTVMDPANWSGVIATVEFANACLAGKMETVAVDFSVGPDKPVQQYLLMMVDKMPEKICGHLPPNVDPAEFVVTNRYAVAVVPNDLKQVSVNGQQVQP